MRRTASDTPRSRSRTVDRVSAVMVRYVVRICHTIQIPPGNIYTSYAKAVSFHTDSHPANEHDLDRVHDVNTRSSRTHRAIGHDLDLVDHENQGPVNLPPPEISTGRSQNGLY